MTNAPGKSYETPVRGAPRLSATSARAGARKGLYRVLALSTLLALIALALVWLSIGPRAHIVSPETGPDGQPASAAGQKG